MTKPEMTGKVTKAIVSQLPSGRGMVRLVLEVDAPTKAIVRRLIDMIGDDAVVYDRSTEA